MLASYLKIALRSLLRQKGYAFINVFGLAVGIGCCLLMMRFVRHELSYDRFQAKADRLYRTWSKEDWGNGREFFYTRSPWPLAPALASSFPEIEETVRVATFRNLVGRGDRLFTERVHVVDPGFFDAFTFPLEQGTPEAFFAGANNVILTPAVANKFFPGQDPVGQTLTIYVGDEPEAFTVTGIASTPPAASSIRFELLVPSAKARDLFPASRSDNWFQINPETYLLLRPDASVAALEAKFPAMVRQALGGEDSEVKYELGLQPITAIHLDTAYPAAIEPTSDPAYTYILLVVALLVLGIAAINFVTLTVGQSVRRAREVGVRKAMGALRPELMRQFWGESLLLVALSLVLGTVLATFLQPAFDDLAGRDLPASIDVLTMLFLLVLLVIVGIGAGSYPALVLSGFRPIEALKDRLPSAGGAGWLRRGLVVAQFALSTLLIIGTLFVVRQLNFLQTTDLGFDDEQVVVLRTGVGLDVARPLIRRFRHALTGHQEVAGITASAYALDEGWLVASYTGDDGIYHTVRVNWVQPGYFETMGMQLVAGRPFDPNMPTDSTALIVNETLLRDYGWRTPQEALGKHLPKGDYATSPIIGVVKDFNYASLKSTIEPLVITQVPRILFNGADDVSSSVSSNRKIAVRLGPGNVAAGMDLLKQTWENVADGLPFDYYFLDEAVDSQYRQEEHLARIIGAGAGLSIVIACLGLFGLALLTVSRRTKEIGIRKVLGATVHGIALLLARDFAALVLVAVAVAVPVAYLFLQRWLGSFAYHTDMAWWVFALAGAGAMAIALLTVAYQSIRAATADPVKALRYE